MEDTTPLQRHYERDATRAFFEKRHTVVEMQSGPNPLTQDEIKILKQRRPDLWGFLPDPKP